MALICYFSHIFLREMQKKSNTFRRLILNIAARFVELVNDNVDRNLSRRFVRRK